MQARAVRSRAKWTPERQEVIWIDCNPQAGREMRDPHPFLVLSPKAFNDRTMRVTVAVFAEACARLNQIVRLAEV